MLASGVDGVVIASSTATHPDLIRACVAGRHPHVLREAGRRRTPRRPWPSATSWPTATYRCRSASRVASTPPTWPPATTCSPGRLGYVHTVRSTTLDPAPPPEAYILSSGGIFNDCAIHDFDSIRWATGQEVVEVYAAGSTQGIGYISEAGDAETATSVLTLSGGTLAVVSNTRANGRGHDVRLELLGSEDSVSAGLDERLPLRSTDAGVAFPTQEPWEFFMDRFADAFRAELDRVHRGRGRHADLPVHRGRRGRGRPRRRGRHRLLPRAPARPHRRDPLTRPTHHARPERKPR